MLPLVCNDAVAILFMFDLTRKSTLNSIKEWYRQGRGFNKTAIPFLVGTKYDHFVNFPREEQEEISTQAKRFAKAMKASLIFSSTSHSINVQKVSQDPIVFCVSWRNRELQLTVHCENYRSSRSFCRKLSTYAARFPRSRMSASRCCYIKRSGEREMASLSTEPDCTFRHARMHERWLVETQTNKRRNKVSSLDFCFFSLCDQYFYKKGVSSFFWKVYGGTKQDWISDDWTHKRRLAFSAGAFAPL